MRSMLDRQLGVLNDELIAMGALCEEAIGTATKALMETDVALASRVSPIEQQIDEKEREIEALCTRLLMQQQPVAKDLRQISAALKMITDMERIGDQSKDIAEMIVYIRGRRMDEFALIGEMAEATKKMVTESVDAYVKRDKAIAMDVIARDDFVDAKFCQIKRALIAAINKTPEAGECAIDLMMIAKYFERIGDHAVNVAEWVVYAVTGMHKGEIAE